MIVTTIFLHLEMIRYGDVIAIEHMFIGAYQHYMSAADIRQERVCASTLYT